MASVATNDRVGREELDAFPRTRHLIRRTVQHRGPIATGGFPARLATG